MNPWAKTPWIVRTRNPGVGRSCTSFGVLFGLYFNTLWCSPIRTQVRLGRPGAGVCSGGGLIKRRQVFDMAYSIWRIARASILAFALTLGAVLAISALPMLVLAQSDSDTPAATCGSGPNVVCPATGDPGGQYIASVTAAPDGVIILLTEAGLEKARACGGPEAIAQMSEALYATIPTADKSAYQLDWQSQTLADEIYGHAFLYQWASGLGGAGSIQERANPINIVFADYGGPGEMTTDAAKEQTIFQALGAAHRAMC